MNEEVLNFWQERAIEAVEAQEAFTNFHSAVAFVKHAYKMYMYEAGLRYL